MIKQIINWTAGGFFRTLGKFILFGLIALILGYFMSQRNINLPLISFGKVYAVVDESFSSAESRLFLDQGGTETYTSWQNIPYTQTASYPVTQMQFRLKATNGFKADNTYRFKVSYLPNPDSLHVTGIWFSDGTSSLDASCTGWVRESNNYYANTCTVSPEVDLSSSQALYVRFVFQAGYVTSVRSWVGTFVESKGVSSTIEQQTIDITNALDDTANSIINNQNENTQAIIESNQTCQDIDKNSVVINGKYLNTSTALIDGNGFGVTDYININGATKILTLLPYSYNDAAAYCFYNVNKNSISCNKIYNTTTITIPESAYYFRTTIQTNMNRPTFRICKNGSQAINDFLTDNDTTQQENEFDALIDDLQFSSEGAIETILMLPINLISSIINPSNQNICFVLKGKNVCFPNGSIIWNRTCNPNTAWWGCTSVSALQEFFQLIAEGFVLWYLLKRIIYTFENVADPTVTSVEILDIDSRKMRRSKR